MSEAVPDPAAYVAGEAFQREREALFAREWLLFAAAAQFPAAGDFVSHSIGGWPLFAVRGADGRARAFHNVCRHQSMPVIDQPAGHCERLRCRYHGWTYGLTGELVEAPERYLPAGPPEAFGLNPSEVAEGDGLCFVRVQPGAAPPPAIAPPDGAFAAAVVTDLDANWKAAAEACLDMPDWRFVWPLALVGMAAPDVGVVRQIVPRSFSRTRLVDLLFAAEPGREADLAIMQRQRAAADKIAAEAVHAARAGGTGAPPFGPASAFLSRVAMAC